MLKSFATASLLLACILTAQTKVKIDSCGLGSHRACHCIEHTQRERNRALDTCLKAAGCTQGKQSTCPDKVVAACFKAAPSHCDLANRYHDTDSDAGDAREIAMADRCSMACKRSDCACDDGPVCHFEHQPSDHGR
jgi:hypothetical protein